MIFLYLSDFPTFQEKILLVGGASRPASQAASQLASEPASRPASQPPASNRGSTPFFISFVGKATPMFVGVTHHLAEEVAIPSQHEEVDWVATNAEEVAIPSLKRTLYIMV